MSWLHRSSLWWSETQKETNGGTGTHMHTHTPAEWGVLQYGWHRSSEVKDLQCESTSIVRPGVTGSSRNVKLTGLFFPPHNRRRRVQWGHRQSKIHLMEKQHQQKKKKIWRGINFSFCTQMCTNQKQNSRSNTVSNQFCFESASARVWTQPPLIQGLFEGEKKAFCSIWLVLNLD